MKTAIYEISVIMAEMGFMDLFARNYHQSRGSKRPAACSMT